jgi:hypothetical protein
MLIAEWSLLSNDGPLLTPTDISPRRKLEYVLDPKELQSFAVQIARGMAHLERKQITHRYQSVFSYIHIVTDCILKQAARWTGRHEFTITQFVQINP